MINTSYTLIFVKLVILIKYVRYVKLQGDFFNVYCNIVFLKQIVILCIMFLEVAFF